MHPIYDPDIEKYLKGKLSPPEREDFQKRLASDPDLALETASYEALLLRQDERIREKMKSMRGGLKSQNNRTESGGRFWFYRSAAAAAAVVLLLLALPFVYNQLSIPSSTKLYNKHYTRFEASGSLSADPSNQAQTNWIEACTLYEKKSYQAAEEKLRPLFELNTYSDQANLLAGTCALEQNNIQAAVGYLEKVNPKASIYYNRAQWYIALARLREGNISLAREKLNAVASDPDNYFRNKAKELLNELKD